MYSSKFLEWSHQIHKNQWCNSQLYHGWQLQTPNARTYRSNNLSNHKYAYLLLMREGGRDAVWRGGFSVCVWTWTTSRLFWRPQEGHSTIVGPEQRALLLRCLFLSHYFLVLSTTFMHISLPDFVFGLPPVGFFMYDAISRLDFIFACSSFTKTSFHLASGCIWILPTHPHHGP